MYLHMFMHNMFMYMLIVLIMLLLLLLLLLVMMMMMMMMTMMTMTMMIPEEVHVFQTAAGSLVPWYLGTLSSAWRHWLVAYLWSPEGDVYPFSNK